MRTLKAEPVTNESVFKAQEPLRIPFQ